MTQPDLARLEGLLTRLRTMGCYGHKSYPTHFINPDGAEAATEIEALLARVRELEKRNAGMAEALEPFARDYEDAGVDHLPDDARFGEVDCDQGQLTVGHLRRARASLTLNKDNPDAG